MNLPSIYYRIVKNKKVKIAALSLAALAVAIAVWIYLTAGNLTTAQARAQFLREHPVIIKILPVYWQIRKLSDLTYWEYWPRRDEVPSYKLEIKGADLEKLDESLPEGFMGVLLTSRVYVPAKFEANGKIYDVQVRYRGDNAVHWNAPKKSYLVRFGKKETLQGLSEISFIIPDDRYFALEQFNNYRAQKLGLPAPVSGFANLEVNDQGQALYFMIESWSREMLDKWGASQNAILYGNTNDPAVGGDIWASLENWQILVDDPKLSEEENFAPLDRLIKLLNEAGDAEFNRQVFNLIDEDNFYAWQIHQELANSSHQADDNVRLYNEPASRKFFFVPWDVESEDPALHDNFEYYGPLAGRIFANPDFLREKNERLLTYLSDAKNLENDLEYYDRTYESFQTSLYRDRLKIYTNRFADRVYREQRQIIADIFHKLSDRLSENSAVRVEDDFNLAYPVGKTDELVTYLKEKYLDDQSFVKNLGPEFGSSYGDEDFTDTYFDTPSLDLYKRQAGLRYRQRTSRLDPEDRKTLVQLKLSGTDKVSDAGNSGSRNEIKFAVSSANSVKTADDRHPLLRFISETDRQALKAAFSELGLEADDLQPILTIEQHRRRVYLNRNGETFISFSMDDAASELWWAESTFSQMEVELNEVAYTGADAALKARMQEIRAVMIADLRGHFDYLEDDQTIKYTKMFDLLGEHLPGMRFLIRTGILRGN